MDPVRKAFLESRELPAFQDLFVLHTWNELNWLPAGNYKSGKKVFLWRKEIFPQSLLLTLKKPPAQLWNYFLEYSQVPTSKVII